MSLRARRLIPVLVQFPEDGSRAESWGRLLEIRPDGGRLMARGRLERGDSLRLSFDLPGERLEGVPADVARVSTDPDGYRVCDLVFSSRGHKVRLGRALRRLASAA